MTSPRSALLTALRDWKRNALAFAAIVVVFGGAAWTSSQIALYGAGLVAFTIWMAWFVLTGADFLEIFEEQPPGPSE